MGVLTGIREEKDPYHIHLSFYIKFKALLKTASLMTLKGLRPAAVAPQAR